jgi:hypothetical protein
MLGRFTKYFCVMFVLGVSLMLQASCANSVTTPKCTITLAQSPEMRGFRLGMTLDELKQKFPNLPEPKYEPQYKYSSKYGLPELEFYSSNKNEVMYGTTAGLRVDANQYADFKGVHNIIVQFLDNKICSIKVSYETETKDPKFKEDFYQKVYESLKLDGAWTQPNSKEEDKRLITCNGFTVEAKMDTAISGYYQPYVKLTNPEGDVSIKTAEENDKIKSKEADEKKRAEFQP